MYFESEFSLDKFAHALEIKNVDSHLVMRVPEWILIEYFYLLPSTTEISPATLQWSET